MPTLPPQKYYGALLGAAIGAAHNARKSKKRGEGGLRGTLNALRGAAGGALGGYAAQTFGSAIKDGTASKMLRDVRDSGAALKRQFEAAAPKGSGNFYQRLKRYGADPGVKAARDAVNSDLRNINTAAQISGHRDPSSTMRAIDAVHDSRRDPRGALLHHLLKPVGATVGAGIALAKARGMIDTEPTGRDDDEKAAAYVGRELTKRAGLHARAPRPSLIGVGLR